MTKPRILHWDIENSPAVGEFWGSPYQTNIVRIIQPQEVISFAAMWDDSNDVEFYSDHHDGHDTMLARAYDLLDEADAVVSYNGIRHDTPHMATALRLAGYGRPSPYVEIDLYRVVKQRFKFQQNKLAFVAQQLLDETKLAHSGHDLWVRCGEGDPRAWATMKRYNIKDVRLTKRLYRTLQGDLPASMRLQFGDGKCDRCGSGRLQKRGLYRRGLSAWQRYQCQGCGGWLRDPVRLEAATIRGI